jgi:hypothetical protein
MRPEALQIVDDAPEAIDVLAWAREAGLELLEFMTYGVDVDEQYHQYLLRRMPTKEVRSRMWVRKGPACVRVGPSTRGPQAGGRGE